jgi:hypothetical protein
MVSSIPYDKRGNLRIRIEGAKGKDPIELTSTYRVAHGLATGGACSSTYQLSGNDQTAYLYADGASWSGWRFRRGDDPKKPGMIAEPISCAAPK